METTDGKADEEDMPLVQLKRSAEGLGALGDSEPKKKKKRKVKQQPETEAHPSQEIAKDPELQGSEEKPPEGHGGEQHVKTDEVNEGLQHVLNGLQKVLTHVPESKKKLKPF